MNSRSTGQRPGEKRHRTASASRSVRSKKHESLQRTATNISPQRDSDMERIPSLPMADTHHLSTTIRNQPDPAQLYPHNSYQYYHGLHLTSPPTSQYLHAFPTNNTAGPSYRQNPYQLPSCRDLLEQYPVAPTASTAHNAVANNPENLHGLRNEVQSHYHEGQMRSFPVLAQNARGVIGDTVPAYGAFFDRPQVDNDSVFISPTPWMKKGTSEPGHVRYGDRMIPLHTSDKDKAELNVTPARGRKVKASRAVRGGGGRYWSAEEHHRFVQALFTSSRRDYDTIAAHVGTRNKVQCRTHQQKWCIRLIKEAVKQVKARIDEDKLIGHGITEEDRQMMEAVALDSKPSPSGTKRDVKIETENGLERTQFKRIRATPEQRGVHSVPSSWGVPLLCEVALDIERTLGGLQKTKKN